MNTYVALLRGINVGGNNIIKMTDLAATFQALGFDRVRTYIQSGNVIFATPDADQAGLTARIEEALSAAFAYSSRVVLRSHDQLAAVVAQAPTGFGSEPDLYRYDVLFLKEPLTAPEAMPWMSEREGVDRIAPGEGVVYASRLISRASQSHISRVISSPIYQNLTIRNWNTTTKLLHMMENARS